MEEEKELNEEVGMMEAKDTVMDDRQLLKFELKYLRDDTFYWGAAFDDAIKEQAEISFKAGKMEVVKFLVKEGEHGLLANLDKLVAKYGKPNYDKEAKKSTHHDANLGG